jgi:DNA-binding MarR family transcriptional regulator
MSRERAVEVADELRAVITAIRRRMQAEGPTDAYTASQLNVIANLAKHGPSTVTLLANIESMRPQSMGAIIATLESIGVVTGSPHPTDGRQTLWTLTPKSADEYNAGRDARSNWLYSAVSTGLSAEQLEELDRSLAALRRMLEK